MVRYAQKVDRMNSLEIFDSLADERDTRFIAMLLLYHVIETSSNTPALSVTGDKLPLVQ
jgi:hypothetical protein